MDRCARPRTCFSASSSGGCGQNQRHRTTACSWRRLSTCFSAGSSRMRFACATCAPRGSRPSGCTQASSRTRSCCSQAGSGRTFHLARSLERSSPRGFTSLASSAATLDLAFTSIGISSGCVSPSTGCSIRAPSSRVSRTSWDTRATAISPPAFAECSAQRRRHSESARLRLSTAASPRHSRGAARRASQSLGSWARRSRATEGGTMATKAIPEGYHTLTPYLAVDDAAKAIDYYKKAFGAKERVRMEAPGGTIGHAELEIGDSLVMLSSSAAQIVPPGASIRTRSNRAARRLHSYALLRAERLLVVLDRLGGIVDRQVRREGVVPLRNRLRRHGPPLVACERRAHDPSDWDARRAAPRECLVEAAVLSRRRALSECRRRCAEHSAKAGGEMAVARVSQLVRETRELGARIEQPVEGETQPELIPILVNAKSSVAAEDASEVKPRGEDRSSDLAK